MKKIRAVNDGVIVECLGKKSGKVVSVGPGRYTKDGPFITPAVEVGEKILYKDYTGYTRKLNGVKHWFGSSDDVLAVYE